MVVTTPPSYSDDDGSYPGFKHDAEPGAHIFSKEEAVICHYKDNHLVAITHFNGHAELYAVKEAMGRKEMLEFFETQNNS